MTKNLQSELREHLDSDETLLWTGKPKSGVVFRLSDIFLIPFSILWCGFAIVWMITAANISLIFVLFGIPFVLIGLLLVFGRFIIDAKQRNNTTYGFTENRILIKSGLFSTTIKSLNIKTLNEIELSEKKDKTGSILLGPKNPFSSVSNGFGWWPGMKATTQFEMIPNAQKVYNQIIEIQNDQ